MRLLANKLFPDPYLAGDIEAFATARLRELAQPAPAPNQPRQPALTNGVDAARPAGLPAPQVAGAVSREAGADVNEAAAAPAAEGSSAGGKITAEPCAAGDAATGASRAAQGAGGGRTDAGVVEPGNSVAIAAAGDGAAERRASGAAASTTEPAPNQVAGALGGAAFSAGGAVSAAAGVSVGSADVIIDSMEAAQQRCDLFCALCTKKPALLHELLRVYGQVPLPSPPSARPDCTPQIHLESHAWHLEV